MTRKRLALVALCIGLTAIAVPAGVQAQKVANPGPFVLQSYQQGAPLSLFKIGTTIPVQYLTQDVSISGSVDAGGNVTIPQSQITFPTIPVDLVPYGLTGLVDVTLVPTADATGTLNANNGQIELAVRVRATVTGVINGVRLKPGCAVGTPANPISLNLRTSGAGSSPYNPTTGRGVLVDDTFSVPGASGCWIPGILGDLTPVYLNDALNAVIGLPSATGRNRIVLEGRTLPALAPGIAPAITMNPPLNPVSNQAIGFSAATSSVAKGPATYDWLFSDGATATGQDVFHTFTATGAQWARLTITDGDGDVATKQTNFNVNTGSPTTTTSTTTTQPTTTTSTTTTQPTTTTSTTTTTTSTTTTQPTTTTSTTTTQPTTTTSTTTTQPTTTTSTTLPASDDSVSVKLTGAVGYENAGTGTGNMTVTNDSFGIRSVSGSMEIPGTDGGVARVDANIQRAWILPLWTGQITVRDAGADVSVAAPVFGQIAKGTTATSAKGTLGWFQLGQFPNLIRPYTLSWSVTDAG
jgi:hypothetical protein